MSRLLPTISAAICGKRGLPEPPSKASLSREEVLSPENPIEGFFSRDEWIQIGSALGLSERELAVTIQLSAGVSRRAIGLSLRKADGSCVSADTVRVYIDRVFRKARVSDRQGLTLRLARIYLLLHGVSLPGTARDGRGRAAR